MKDMTFGQTGDKAQLMELYRQCFPDDEPSFWEWVFDNLYHPENTLNLRQNGAIVASLQMIPCKMQLKDRLFDAHYIYAAATLPQMQGKGLMAGLLEQAAQQGRRRGHRFSVLIAQEDSLLDYYARFGYQGRFLISDFPAQHCVLTESDAIRTAMPSDLLTIDGIYRRETEGMLRGYRDDDFWNLQLKLFGTGAKVLERHGKITAYAFSDERGVIEAAGPDAGLLANTIAPDGLKRTIPTQQARPMGSILPLDEESRALMEQNPCFLNLMYN